MKYLRVVWVAILSSLTMNVFAMGYSQDYVDCMKSSNNQGTTTAECQLDEYKYQNKRLKSLFKKNMALSNAQQKSDLNRLQNQWSSQRELSCGLNNKKLKELGSANVGCALQTTSSRADLLEVQLSNKKLAR